MRKLLSLISGLFLTVFGAVPLLNQLGLISFKLPLISSILLLALAGAAGILLLMDGIAEWQNMHASLGMLSILLALILITLGVLIILIQLGTLTFQLPLIPLAVEALVTLTGILLIIGGFIGF